MFSSIGSRRLVRLAQSVASIGMAVGMAVVAVQTAKAQDASPLPVARTLVAQGTLPQRSVLPIIGKDTARHELLGIDGLAKARAAAAAKAKARKQDGFPERARSIDYSGPRFGVTYLPQAAVDSLKAHRISVSNAITQFGWQFEREIHVSEDGPRVLNEWVLLAGGLESGVFLPSMTWLVGARDRNGNEFGVGPNASVAGVGLAAAAGVTVHSGGVNFPMNIAVAKSKTGARVSFLTGFTIH
jgi:hypothetical protein